MFAFLAIAAIAICLGGGRRVSPGGGLLAVMLIGVFALVAGIFVVMWKFAGLVAWQLQTAIAAGTGASSMSRIAKHRWHVGVVNPLSHVLIQAAIFTVEILIFAAWGNSLRHH